MIPTVLLLILLGAPLSAQTPTLTGVSAAATAGGVSVRFSASAPLPALEVNALANPARLYFDVPGFLPGQTRQWNIGQGKVVQVRAALNQPDPAVTRVVIDLAADASWTVERSASGREFSVIVAAPPAVDRTLQIAGQLYSLEPALQAMRDWRGPSDGELAAVLAESEAIAEAARAAKMSGTREALLVSGAAEAVLAAARARAAALGDGSDQSRRNAVSAAAGALLLMEYARRK